MLDVQPFEALALSLHHSPGVFAALVGSGLSRSAGIPTGWDITLELVRRVAALQGVTEHQDWAAWHRQQFGEEPSYSKLLDALAKTAAERRVILESFIEAEEGNDARRPTKAHHALAKLAAEGAIRVIITTNFDRLIENALREAGVEPTVIASDDAVAGATPLVHARCTVIKLHGDYLDSRIRNTDEELSRYGEPMDRLLDEVFDSFGLLVVGWSGEWDTALRSAILRTTSRRYPVYWTARGKLATLAEDLISHRDGRLIQINDADSFFGRLSDAVEALRQSSRPHPSSVAMAVALAKRYCRDDARLLEWEQLLLEEVEKVRAFVTSANYINAEPNLEGVKAQVQQIIARTEILRRACLICARWGTPKAMEAVARAMKLVVLSSASSGGYAIWISLMNLPASLCFYWALAGSAAKGDYSQIAKLMQVSIRTHNSQSTAVSELALLSLNEVPWNNLHRQNFRFPASEFALALFKSELGDAALDPSEADELFDEVEFLICAQFAYERSAQMAKTGLWFWAPPGRFVFKRDENGERKRLDALKSLSADDIRLKAGLLGGTPTSARAVADALIEFLKKA